jgi:ppGpp synthetase/RelA/SpoT-type nucleotidyltranferase
LRDNVTRVGDIQEKIEDLIGLRIVTLNKKDARTLFEYLQGRAGDWFCEKTEAPKFVSYTWESTNRYSMKSGYQAFHVTFLHPRQFPNFTLAKKWPVEIQITTKLWYFWSDYSRRYFYRGTGEEDDAAEPYNVAISRILDSAEDLMIATAESFLMGPSEETSQPPPKAKRLQSKNKMQTVETKSSEKTKAAPADVWEWLAGNRKELIGEDIKMPNEIFISKIAHQLNVYGMTLGQLEKAMKDPVIRDKYKGILAQSSVRYLPIYQQILCFVLLSLGYSTEEVVAKVNDQLFLLGIRLRAQ